MTEEVKNALVRLTALNLKEYPHKECKDLISKLGKFGVVKMSLHKGKKVMRARPNGKGEVFLNKSDLSYKPQKFNTTYQRASTPNQTMFYGSVIPENVQLGELDNERVIGAFESLSWLRDPFTKGYQKITYGKWIVKEDIEMYAVIQHKDFYNKSQHIKELADHFKAETEKIPDLKEVTLAVADYVAKEFAKTEIKGDFDYLPSAVFTEVALRSGLHGIYYPSVRVDGRGFNIAISPEVADRCLDLVVAGECSIYKLYDRTIVDNETIAIIGEGKADFELKAVDPAHRKGQDKCLKDLGLTSLDQLIG